MDIINMILQDDNVMLRIQDSKGASFSCPSSEFQTYEPEYQALPDGILLRVWNDAVAYLSNGSSQFGDPFYTYPRFVAFCSRIAQYQAAYDLAHQVEPPTIYATLSFSGGDGKIPIGLKLGHATKGVMDITGDLRAAPDAPGLPVNVSYAWRITIRRVVSEFATQVVGSVPVDGCTVVNNAITWTGFNPETAGLSQGIYMISDEDFAPISGAAFGLPQDYQVTLVGGNKFFKVLK